MPEEQAPGAALVPDALKAGSGGGGGSGPGSAAASGLGASGLGASLGAAVGGSGYAGTSAHDPFGVEAINAPSARGTACACLLPLASGALLTAGSDRCVRCVRARARACTRSLSPALAPTRLLSHRRRRRRARRTLALVAELPSLPRLPSLLPP